MSANDDKIIQPIGYIKAYEHGTCKNILHENEKTKNKNITGQSTET